LTLSPQPAVVVPRGHLRVCRLWPAPEVDDALMVLASRAEAEGDGGAGGREDARCILARGVVLGGVIHLRIRARVRVRVRVRVS